MSETLFSDALKQLMDEFTQSGIRELHVRKADFELYLSTDSSAGRYWPAAQAPIAASSAPPPQSQAASAAPITEAAPIATTASALPDNAVIVTAPNLGTFYRAPKPGAANYVEVGSKVKAGDELCLIEVMKLFTALRADEAGTIHSVLVEDGAMVEGGQPLFALVKD
ncbi:MAG: acetyl-CoA carboxylase biotin carboxyl carrier protein [Novosphingobium sp.]|uniref:acetyl-CoA carboxylase biotin carboxyl carrier protein n=1 Tax=Sphingobium yanoikuyae TaxID=13690 RepID=UPI000846F9B7|nr:acetyl-CoA carboxylase biotin carboxyl carrier protein [Sphingobium yanoikuyae]